MSLHTSYLFTLCDFHISYAGCSNLSQFIAVDNGILALHIIQIILYAGYLLIRFYRNTVVKKLPVKTWSTGMDTLAILITIYGILRVSFVANSLSIQQWNLQTMTDNQIQTYTRTNIYIDFLVWLFGGLGATALVVTMVSAASGGNLYSKIQIGSKEVDPEKILKIVRLLYIILSIIFCSLWAYVALPGTVNQYILYRRYTYLLTAFVSWFVSTPVLFYFGHKVIVTMKLGSELHSSKRSEDKGSKAGKGSTVALEKKATASGNGAEGEVNLTVPAAAGSGIHGGSSHGPTGNLVASNKEKAALKRYKQVNALSYSIYGVVFILYVGTGFYAGAYVVANETITTANGLLIAKILCNCYLWVATSFFSFYLWYTELNRK